MKRTDLLLMHAYDQCDQIGRNFAIWANFFCLGRNFFQEFIYYWAIFWAKFYLLWANFFPSLFTIGRIFSEIWANFFSNRLVTLPTYSLVPAWGGLRFRLAEAIKESRGKPFITELHQG